MSLFESIPVVLLPDLTTRPFEFGDSWSREDQAKLKECFLIDLFQSLRPLNTTHPITVMPRDAAICRLSERFSLRTHSLNISDSAPEREIAGAARAIGLTPPMIYLRTDSPVFPPSYLTMATRELSRHDAVIGPDAETGVYLLAVAREVEPMIVETAFSGPVEGLLERFRAGGLRAKLLPIWFSPRAEEELDFLFEHLGIKVANRTLTESATLEFLTKRADRANP